MWLRVRFCIWCFDRSADAVAVQRINRYAAANANRNCNVSGAADVWLFERMDDKKAAAVSFLDYHDAGGKSGQRNDKSGAAEHGGKGIYCAYLFNSRLCNRDTWYCAAAGNDSASGQCGEKGRGQKDRGLKWISRRFCLCMLS